MTEVPEDDKAGDEGEQAGEAHESDEQDDTEDMDLALQQARFRLDVLKVAIRFVQDEVPPYGIENSESGRASSAENLVPPSIDLVRRRALIAAYGLIEREFNPRMEADREDA